MYQVSWNNIHESSNSSFTILINCSSTNQLSVHQTSTTKTSLTWNVLKSSQTYIFKTWYHQLSSYIHAKWTVSWWCGFNVYISFIHDLFTWDVNVNTTSNCTVLVPTRKALNNITTVDQWASCTIDNSIWCTKWAETNIHESSNSSFTILISCSSTSQLSVHQTSTTKTSLTWNVLKSSQPYIFKTWYHQLSSYIHAKWTFSRWCGFNVYSSFIHDLFTWGVNGNTTSNCTVFLPARKGLFNWLK